MPKYNVNITEGGSIDIVIEAASPEEAEAIATEKYENGDINAGLHGWVDIVVKGEAPADSFIIDKII